MNLKHLQMSSLLAMFILSCASLEPEPIYYGEDNCAHCRMTIIDQQFGCEIISAKGKVFKFDSIECLAAFENSQSPYSEEISSAWVTDFTNAGTLINREQARFVRSLQMRSPMGAGLFAFSSEEDAKKFATQQGGELLDFQSVKLVIKEIW